MIRRWQVLLCALFLTVTAVLVTATVGLAGDFRKTGEVTRVVDGDTIDVTDATGATVRIRIIGIDSPETGACWAAKATARTTSLAERKQVTLIGDATQATRDRYGRLLAYVGLPGGGDLGFQLIAGGDAKVYVYNHRPFKRFSAYERAESLTRGKGLWSCGSLKPSAGAGRVCKPGYSPCLPIVGDLDCGDINDSLKPIRVTGSDPYRLDADGDGLGCE